MKEMIKFDTTANKPSIIKVIGVGGGGSNAVNHMYEQGIRDVDFILCNTDSQALDMSQVPLKIQLGTRITEGRGAGSIPSVGKECALENLDELRSLLQDNTKMLFITAGMGGGTGTGAAPVIASVAKELGILTVAIVTLPFSFEGSKRKKQAEEGISELRKYVDTLLIICNEKLRELHGDLKLSEAFRKADNILTTAAKGIAEIITVPGYVNVDFEDVKTVMNSSGVAIMGTGLSEGENRAIEAVEMALSSPLLNDSEIIGARNILLYIASGTDEISMDEVSDITDYIQREAGSSAEIIWGNGYDESLGNKVSVTIIATGFDSSSGKNDSFTQNHEHKKNVLRLDHEAEKKQEVSVKKEEADHLIDLVLTEKQEVEYKNDTFIPKEDKPAKVYQLEMPVDDITDNNITSNIRSSDTGTEFTLRSGVPGNNKPQTTITERPNEIGFEEYDKDEKNLLEKKRKERFDTLRNISMKLKTPEGLDEYEKQPAYLRREVTIDRLPSSKDSTMSDYTISTGKSNKGIINGDNSFLNKNVD